MQAYSMHSRQAMETGDEALGNIEIFADLPRGDLASIGQRCRWRRYVAEQQILGHQEQSTEVYFVVEGRVRAEVYSQNGKEVALRDIETNEIFGEFAAIDGAPRAARVVALSDCHIASMTAEVFREVLRNHPSAMEATMRLLVRQIRSLSERVFELTAHNVKRRIREELLRLAQRNMVGESRAVIDPMPKQQDFALRIGTGREAVSRELGALERAGLIERPETRIVVVPDVDRLAGSVHEDLD